MGCGLGEVTGLVVGLALGLSSVVSLTIGVTLGFIFGFYLGTRPLVKAGMSRYEAFRTIFIAEFISIAVMETAEVLIQVYTPGVMAAGLGKPIFWLGMLASLAGGFVAAYPVNYVLVKKGMKHCH